ncbi:thioesterase [Halobacteriovorax marinus]|uniref:Thioesterase n=1 Tax=Halobacteriovorax marinus TaxID=97084 RepID=A0A1Y5F113_9BACT|nr:thioesterase [Halobacteriovorax marinus]
MSIWFNDYDLDPVNKRGLSSMTGLLDIQVTELKENSLVGTMPVTDKTKQPFGLLHGGASCVLAESLGSIASNLVVDPKKFAAVGQSINASHIKSAKSGLVTGICEAIHIGKKSHVWEIKIFNEEKQLVCVSRLTMAIITK